MRRGLWVVLGLVGMAPVGALAQQAQGQPTGQGAAASGGARQAGTASGGAGQQGTATAGDTSPPIIVELPARGEPIASDRATGQRQPERSRTGTGGSGQDPSRPAQAATPDEEIFVGTVRAVTGDRLRMVSATGDVYEFGLGRQTRILGPNGAAMSIQAVREGALVRTVTRDSGELENQVVTLQLFGQAPPVGP